MSVNTSCLITLCPVPISFYLSLRVSIYASASAYVSASLCMYTSLSVYRTESLSVSYLIKSLFLDLNLSMSVSLSADMSVPLFSSLHLLCPSMESLHMLMSVFKPPSLRLYVWLLSLCDAPAVPNLFHSRSSVVHNQLHVLMSDTFSSTYRNN